MRAKHYLEMHITLDPVPADLRETLQQALGPVRFKLAKLLMDKGVPSQLDAFMTGHARELEEAKQRTTSAIRIARSLGLRVRRYKIEDTVMDSRIADELKLAVSADRRAISLAGVGMSDDDQLSPTSAAIQHMAKKLAVELDLAIGAAITKHLGHDRWTIEEIKGRCHNVTHRGNESETFHLDGVPLVRAHKPELSAAGMTYTATRKIETLV